MQSGKATDSKVNDFEAQNLKKFINYNENTSTSVVSNSVGMAILMLKKNYYGENLDDKKVDSEFEACK